MYGVTNYMDKVLIDSCIIIDFMKAIVDIEHDIETISKPCINFIVEMELMQGAKNKQELRFIKK